MRPAFFCWANRRNQRDVGHKERERTPAKRSPLPLTPEKLAPVERVQSKWLQNRFPLLPLWKYHPALLVTKDSTKPFRADASLSPSK